MKTLLLDIDNTLFSEEMPRPFLKEFLAKMSEKYTLCLYTAANHQRITQVCRIMYHQLLIRDEWLHELACFSLSRENCPMIDHGSIQIKCLRRAALALRIDYTDIAFLLDDMPMHDNPDREKRIQVPGFYGQPDDTFLMTLILPDEKE